MGAGELPFLAVVVGSTLAAYLLLTFGLLRRGEAVAWESGAHGGGRGPEAPAATDPAIARRIAELIRAPDDMADPEREAESLDDEMSLRVGPHIATAMPDPLTLSDGSDESAIDPAELGPEAWPAADPGVRMRYADDPFAPLVPAPTIDRDGLARLLTDPLTGLGTPLAWEVWIADEEPRERRYRRPTTIVLAELDGLDALGAFYGADVAERAAVSIGAALRANVRTSDRAAVVGPGLYAVLLTETDEVRAVNFVERVRVTFEELLAESAPAVRIAFGWASPQSDGLAGACARAEQRLVRERA